MLGNEVMVQGTCSLLMHGCLQNNLLCVMQGSKHCTLKLGTIPVCYKN